jgi:hypothetical protein
MSNLENITVRSALEELYQILSCAYDSDGVFGFNSVTVTGNWYAETDEEAEQILEALDAKIDGFYSREMEVRNDC